MIVINFYQVLILHVFHIFVYVQLFKHFFFNKFRLRFNLLKGNVILIFHPIKLKNFK